jgi:type 1 glutamine amidotransferase
MKIIRALFITALLATIATAEENKPIRVLLTYGGHGFQQKEFFAFWDALPGVKYTTCELPKQADMLKPGLEKEYNAIVTYDMVKGFTPEQQKAFTNLLNTGIGLVSTHHSLGAHDTWSEYTKIIGGKYMFKPTTIDDKSRVCYLMLGHDNQAWANPNYKELLLRSIRWTIAKD